MAANNIILAVPSANSTVNYDLPDNESATLSFAPEDISGLNLDANGGLVISFVEGGNVTLTNFQSFVDKGNTLSLSDGTNVDPKLLFSALGGQNDNPFPGADVTKIGIPSENAQKDITLEPGKKYLFDFDLAQTQGADVKDGKMVINFANGGKIVIPNYETAMADQNPPELSLASKTCVVSGDELITNIKALAVAPAAGETVVVEEEIEEEAKQKSKIAAADMEGKDDIGPGDETALGYRQGEVKEGEGDSGEAALSEAKAREANEIKTAAGEDAIAAQLASIETAAGGPAGGRSNSGYGYGSRPGSDPFVTNPDIGPIDPTQLNYQAPILTPSEYVARGDKDSSPEINPATKMVDETNLENGPVSVSGTLNIDFGADGPGSVKPNGSFASGGSQTGNLLSSNGEPVTVNVVGNKYVGTTAGGDVAFELVIENDGDYTFTQYLPLDHADGSDANDQIVLNFGVTAKDGDGDAIKTTIKIIVADDAPEIEGASGTVDESDIGPNPITVGGTLAHDFNEDGPGTIETTGQFSSGGSQLNGNLTSGGVAVDVTSTPNGYVGTANGVTVFTLTIDPATGDYTYTQYKNLDHADANNPNDEITLTFGAKIIDFDGDTDTAPIVITVRDDAPTFQPPEDPEEPEDPENPIPGHPTPDHGLEVVDETGLKPGPLVETGTLDADFGSDVPGSYGFKPGSFASSGSKTGGELTHNGVPVVVTLNNGVWTGVAGDKTIFTLELNTSTGGYTYTQYDNFDHADGNDPNDQIVLDFGVAASDFDGDSADGSIRIIVKDDAPVANDDVNTYDTTFGVANGNVITGVNGGPGAADVISSDSDTTAQQNSVVKIAFGDHEVDVPATGTVSIDGEYGTLTIAADGTYTYKAFDDGDMVVSEEKEFVSGPALPDFDEGEALDGVEQQSLGIAPGNLAVEAGDVVTVKYVGEQAGYSNTLGVFTITADGTLKAETILIKSSDQATAGQSFSYTAANNAVATGFFLLADAANTYAAFDGIDLSVGRLDFVYNYGQPGEREAKATDDGANIKLVYTDIEGNETVVDAPMYFTSDRGGVDNLNADGSVRVVSGIPGDDNTVLRVGFEDLPGLGDKDFNDMVFDVSIKGKKCGCGDDDIKDVFTYTLKDGDGDTDKATLTLNGQDLTDDQPILTAPAAQTVDETNLKDGVPTKTGTIDVDFGHDGPGTVDPNGLFSSTGSKLNDKLTSGGVPVVVSVVGDTYVGKAGGNTVFTLQIKDDGTYTFKLLDNLDHADGSDPNDIITLKFGVKATDCDGDKSSTTVVIHVKDDAPVAHNDNRSLDEGQTINGNVTNNDVPGQDTPATVTKVEFNGVTHTVPANGTSITITGDHGVLTIDKTGAYTYKSNSDGTDNFKYTLTDRDGDSDKAILSICSDDIDTTPTIVKPGKETVDETDLKNGAINEGGTITADFKDDGPGSFGGNGSFSSGGSKLGGNLTSGGVPVNVTLEGNTYVGKAGDVTVFTLVVNPNGSYNFTLLEQLDHADGSNPNDEISLNFGIDAIDADGDKASTTLTVNVRDDAPVAKNDSNSAGEGQTVTGNVTKNDSPGQDTPATVTKVSFNGTSYDVPASGKLVIQGAYGKLTIDHTGAYSYTAKSNNPNGTDNFVYTLKDNDGDTDTACLSIDVTCTDDKPTITAAIETVDETSLSSGTITETGSVTANYFSDGPGSISGNGSFTSGGSKLGGNLTSGGVPVNVTLEGDTYVGKAGGNTVFTLQITDDGTYTFKLLDNLDHADGNNPNDVINLNFGVVATDADGDKASSTITVKVKDDAPVANDDRNEFDFDVAQTNGNVITGLNGGPGAADTQSQDTPNKVTKIAFGGASVDVPSSGEATINGTYGKLTIKADGSYTYKLFDGVTSGEGGNGGSSQATFAAGDVAGTASSVTKNGITIYSTNGADLTFVNEGDGDGVGINGNGSPKIFKGEVMGMTFADNISKATITMADVGANNLTTGMEYRVYVTGSATPISGEIGFANMTVKNGHATFSLDAATLAPGKQITKIEIYSSNEGQFKQSSLVLDSVKVYYPPEEICIKDEFTYTLTDRDGDSDPAKLTLSSCGVVDPDYQPIIANPDVKTIDETNLQNGIVTVSNQVTADFGGDAPGTITGNGSFTSGGSKLGGNLTHNGTAVVVSYDKNTGTYTGVAGSVTVFTLAITSTGAYTFKLFEQLDHADGNNPNDVINLNFGVVATDADGDKASSTITVKVKDDAPVANDDHNTADTNPATGNVITGLNGGLGAKDSLSQDVANKVVKVSFDGKTVDVPATGTATIEGSNGVLKIAADGSYTYTAKPGSSSTGEEKTFVGGPALPDFDESEALDGVEKQSLGVAKGNLSVGEGDVITVKFVGEQAGYSNTLGIFTVDASGKLKAETIVIKNSDTANNAPHSYTAGEDSVATGFFIIADGATINKNYSGIDLTKGSLDFVYKYGTGSAREATISDNGADVKLVYTAENGTKTVINGPMYFTSDRGDISSLNADGSVRVVSGLPNEQDNTVLRVGFEDLPCLGDKDYNDVVFDISITNADCKCDNADVFTYTLKDGDGDTDTATLTVDCAAPLPITVDIKADDVCVKEDSSVKLPVSANFLNGTGNETMTLTLSGVKAGWKVTGWTDTGNGTYTLVLPKGQSSYSGELTFKPPANSDADLTGLVFKASVYDPDTKQTTTDTDGAKVIVDAVVDDFSFNAGVQEHNSSTGKVFVLTKKDHTINAKINITDLTRPDADGSESLKKIVFTIADGMDDTTFISVKNANGSFTKVGTKGTAGSDTTYTIDLSGMTYAQAKDYITNKLYLTNTGKSGLNGNYNLGIQIVSYEKNLSGVEKDYSDNQTSHSVCLPIMFCISPLVIDLDRDGVELTNLDTNPVLFDITSDGVKDQTGWAAKDDGLLALDRNKDGKINDRSELFGNDDTHDNGFAALAAYDLNSDGKIDKNDAVFKDLKVWQDKNGDGISQASELKSLKDLKIASIDLHAKDVAYDIAGNPVTHESTVVYEDGSKSDIVDAWFAYKDGTATGVDKGLTLMGTEGADLLAGTNGQDTLYGGAGADTFLFQTISEAVDTVKDFNAAEGDKIDLSQMLSQFDPVTDAITDFVFATVKDGNTILAVNDNGTGAAGAHAVAVLENVDVSVADLLKNGSIVV